MNIEARRITVGGIAVDVVRKDIKNLHLGVYPPYGRVRVAAPLIISDEAVRLAVIDKLGWIKRQQIKFADSRASHSVKWSMVKLTTSSAGASGCECESMMARP